MKNWVRTLLVLFGTTMLDFLQLVNEYIVILMIVQLLIKLITN